MRHISATRSRSRRWLPALLCAGLILALSGCAQGTRQSETAGDEEQLSGALLNYESGAPLNGREIPNGPGIFSGSEGGFIIFRK